MKVALLFIGCIIALSGISYVAGWFGQAADVAQEEFGPRAALQKYEWFKDQAAAIKTAELSRDQFKSSLKDLEEKQEKAPDAISRQLMEGNVTNARNDLTAFEANLKNLKEEFNAASAKFNWSAFKDSDIPQKY